MATTDKRLCKGTLSNSSATLYTAPASSGNYTIIKAVTLCNTTNAVVNVYLLFDGTAVISNHSIAAYDTITIPFIDHIIEEGDLIAGYASAASAVNYYISGKEVT